MTRKPIRKTKIVATLGPACDSPETISSMIDAGMNVARLNFSHGSHEEHRKVLLRVREASRRLGANVAMMLDTKGVEIRTGKLDGGAIQLDVGDAFALYTDKRIGNAQGVSVSYPELANHAEPGARILLSDGQIELALEEVRGATLHCVVRRGGRLEDRKGVNVPGMRIDLPAMSAENRDDLLFAIEHDIVYVAASFVRNASDVEEIRELLRMNGSDMRIIAKIESADGVRNLNEIVAVADGIMVARGDLGVEIPVEQVPIIQKRIIQTTVTNGKPVITATQMLDSMERNPTPTRAEVSDVANAIFDGTSAVMLSGETAVGRYPIEAVRTISDLALEAEASLSEFGLLQNFRTEPAHVATEAVSQAAIAMANHMNASAILALTESGLTARSISKYRPRCPILGVTTWPEVARGFALNWGVTGILIDREGTPSNDDQVDLGIQRARESGYVQSGDVVVVTAGSHREAGSTNLIRLVDVP